MNFLAHLHLASLAESSLLGNVMADFVRGNPDADYPADIASGIRLHRRVDKLTDSLEAVRQARRLFSQAHYRVAPIALDVLWDHFLSLHWEQVESQIPLTDFIHQARDNILPQLPSTPPSFQHINQYIWKDRWLERYAELPFIANTLHNMAIRRPKLAALSYCIQDIELNYAQLEETFMQFYPLMMQQAKSKNL
ncbi:acyl carrier protein phosphodiesterase [Pragia fontium]|uniref:Acyl carrier protein phosphodiesterase n=1 Tax=Pragia fontium DSM 5563 = ATCC 49100 TaxID=1122977 RepID=A0AAJ4WAU3_9GAMM|nr:ACP phosphodiesterase [Pragia fontium]AKJ43891.1 ACP phosphodiesterase [Pragia fontium]SFC87521.1 acyl carrier protein phosphodiesterase [Pragia fontium DSM 5563 = ATCC 49100]VEJ56068.1 acyl carrier protein phosphodiesterase [Pragia fontium]